MTEGNRIYRMDGNFPPIIVFPIRGKGLEWKDFPLHWGKEPDEEV